MLCYALRAAIAWRAYPAAAHGIVTLYATAAAWLFAVVLITGVISALVLVPLGSLLTTSYGLFLVAKAAVVCAAAGLAVAGRMWLRRPGAGAGPALATKLEVAALAVVIAITGILTVLTPPNGPSSAPSSPALGALPAAGRQSVQTKRTDYRLDIRERGPGAASIGHEVGVTALSWASSPT
jgi:copper transport protein